MNKYELGQKAEILAVDFLMRQGYEILERNYRQRFGEIDIIALDGGTLCFIEVKARESDDYGHPFEAVTVSKQRTIRKVAQMYLLENTNDRFIRFDVVGIQFQSAGEVVIELLKDAF